MKEKNIIWDQVRQAKTVAISGHIRPDGDCIGSCMGLYLYMKKVFPNIKTDVYLEKPSDIFYCIKDMEMILDASKMEMEEKPYDLFFALDCNEDRLGEAGKFFQTAKMTINIDHHISNRGCGAIHVVKPDASSTSELIYELIDQKELDEEIAKALYIGIIHDTGVFQYSNTSPSTLKAAAKLITYGFDFPKLIEETFYEKTYVQNQILGRALLESIQFMDGTCIAGVVDKKVMDFYGVSPSDLDGIVNQLRYTKGVECAIFLYENELQNFKVSMRSKGKVDVAKVAQYFGGGGHIRAAGCTINGTQYDVINNLSRQIEKQME